MPTHRPCQAAKKYLEQALEQGTSAESDNNPEDVARAMDVPQ